MSSVTTPTPVAVPTVSVAATGFIASIKAFLKGILHTILIPVVTVLKALNAGITHLENELTKV